MDSWAPRVYRWRRRHAWRRCRRDRRGSGRHGRERGWSVADAPGDRAAARGAQGHHRRAAAAPRRSSQAGGRYQDGAVHRARDLRQRGGLRQLPDPGARWPAGVAGGALDRDDLQGAGRSGRRARDSAVPVGPHRGDRRDAAVGQGLRSADARDHERRGLVAARPGGRGRVRDRGRDRAGGARDQDVHDPASRARRGRARPRRGAGSRSS